MFETPEERNERITRQVKKTLVITIALSLLILLSWGAYSLWDSIRPLPTHEACEQRGMQGGERIDNETIACWDDCETNKPSSCKMRWTVLG